MAHLSKIAGADRDYGGKWLEGDDWRPNESHGTGRIANVIDIKSSPSNVPTRRRVRLYREIDGTLLRETWSDAKTGAYSFDWLDINARYTVIAYDYEHNYRAVVADNLTPEPMP